MNAQPKELNKQSNYIIIKLVATSDCFALFSYALYQC